MIKQLSVLEGMAALPSDSVDLVIADPPYGGILPDKWDSITNYRDFSEEWLAEAKRILKPTGSIYCWCSLGPKSTSLLDIAAILKRDFVFQDMIVWKKQRGRGCRKGWLFTREEILWATKTKDYVWNKQDSKEQFDPAWQKRLGRTFKRATNVWSDIDEPTIARAKETGCKGNRKPQHPCEKPVEISKRIIEGHTSTGDFVVSLFAGIGADCLAASQLGRRTLGFEIDPLYCSIANERLASG